jgi:hypothetical protein
MASVKISDLPILNELSANNANTVFVAVDKTSNTTVQFPTNTLAEGLYANNVLNVGTEVSSDFPGLIAQFVANTAPYGQVNFENANTEGSMDLVMTADIGDDANNFLDLGINNSGYVDPAYSATKASDGYLIMHGSPASDYIGNLVLGTAQAETNVLFSIGGTTNLDVFAKMTKYGLAFDNGGYITFDDGTTQITAAGDPAIALSAQANTIITQGVDATQNTNITAINQYAASAYAQANTNSDNITIIQGVNLTQNTNITAVNNYAASGYAKANAALANATGTFAGDLNITGGLTVANTINGSNVSIGNQIQFTSNATIRTASGNDNEKDILILTGDEIATDNGGAITVKTGAGTLTGRGGDINIIPGPGGLGGGNINLTGNTIISNYVDVVNSNFDANVPLVQITASDGGSTVVPSNSYYMMHITGKANNVTRFVLDSFGANTYPLVSGRMGRGSAAAPAATSNNDVLMRVVGNGYTGTQFPSSSPSKIDMVAGENFTDSARGTRIEFWNTPNGSNTIQKIASFNANSVDFTGTVSPEKGFIYTPTILPGNQTAFTIDFATTSLIKAELIADCTISLSNYTYGKVVEVWLTNTSGNQRTITHGCLATNSTTNSTTFNMSATSSAYLRYFSIDGDNANTFVAIQAA